MKCQSLLSEGKKRFFKMPSAETAQRAVNVRITSAVTGTHILHKMRKGSLCDIITAKDPE